MASPGFAETKHLLVDQAMGDYLVGSCSAPDPVVSSLVERTAAVGEAAGMMATAQQATLLTMLAGLVNARTAVDIGTFTGLSALALARGLRPGGQVITCDVTDHYLGMAREHWQRAGVDDRIEFRLGAAARTLREMPEGTALDIVFIDADKMNYPKYYELALPLLRSGGLLVADNVLLDGWVVDPARAEAGLPRRCAETLRKFNATLAADERVDAVMLPLADGLTIARKR
jgi:predicted O-methyltransferase YrrM